MKTVRYPFFVGTGRADDKAKTAAHNAQYPDYDTNVKLLNENVVAWLTSSIVVQGKVIPTNVHKKYQDCLNAPNYTVFSNTTSAAEWNDNLASGAEPVVPLESPHNSIHLSVGL
jgi:tyrosinase